jgi:outer membrane protein OmpA-like peptidoglycan-associated protein
MSSIGGLLMLRNFVQTIVVLFLVFSPVRAQEEQDVKGGQDHPLLSRMPGFYLSGYEAKDFDSYTSSYLSGAEAVWEGKLTKLDYTLKTGAKPVSMVQIARNYENAIRQIGGKILSSDPRIITAKIEKAGAITHVEVAAYNDGRDYEVVIVESKAMEQEVTANAAALSQSIAATGKAAVYGIYFDTGKSVIKPESDPTLEEIAKLLKNNPQLQVYVVGHTDSVGTLEANLKLSADRADAVVKALVGRGIEAPRLKSAGVGPYSPAASNKTDEGKAKNRRVELVERN